MSNFNIEKISEQISEILNKYKKILIFIKGSPDPDVIASSFALAELGRLNNTDIYIYAQTQVSLPQNKSLIKSLKIPIHFHQEMPDINNFDAYVVMDHQLAFIKEYSIKIPCAIHIDHHIPEEENLEPDLKIISDKIGSVATLFALVYKNLSAPFNDDIMARVSTALTFGINTDTNSLEIGTSLDREAIKYLSKYTDKKLIDEISTTPFSPITTQLLNRAAKHRVIYKKWLVSGLEPIAEKYRDNIAIIADYLLSINKDIDTVIIFTIIREVSPEGLHIDASFRTRNKKLDLNKVIKSITYDGGGRQFKGAFQVDLDYFVNYPEITKLWTIVKQTTMDKIKKACDMVEWEESRGAISRFKNCIKKLFR